MGGPGRGGEDAGELVGVGVRRLVGHGFDRAHQVGLRLGVQVDQPEPARTLGGQVEPAVGQPLDVAQHCGAADRVQARDAVVVGRPALPDRDDAELAVGHRARDEVDGELAVARLEDVQRQRRPGQQHRAQGKQRERLGHPVTVRRRGFRRRVVRRARAARRTRRSPAGCGR
ncbi:hypothetical protein BJF90_41615 [Pseudonocardia sp. CNS-004]|nr:hypothetical protein BJF90_41615 [Pseudonocardia sp. CNS-004]